MNNAAFPAGKRLLFAFPLALSLASCAYSGGDYGIERLASCSLEESPFATLDFDAWANTYHRTVADVIKADTDSLSNAICPDSSTNLPPPTKQLRDLAAKLLPWLSPARLQRLSEADLGAVLLEYLRTYECAMLDYRTFLYPVTQKTPPGSAPQTQTIAQYNELRAKRDEKIQSELRVSRTAMNRTLALTGRLNRLRPVFYDVNCFVAASLDLRNQWGLIGEIGSCSARIRDTHTSLRDVKASP
jgi:hypothetical protein